MQPPELGKPSTPSTEKPTEPQRSWWPLNELPSNTVPYTVHALGEIAFGSILSTIDWPA